MNQPEALSEALFLSREPPAELHPRGSLEERLAALA